MGIRTEEIPDVEEVIIRKSDKEIVIEKPAVNVMEMQGQKTFQITGESYEIARSNKEMAVDEEDIELVISQTGCSREEAIKALEKCDGQPAEAIIDIMSR
ncbi:MAG: nascent polypeptide-associated complex subunit alpha [Candidatus Methanomethylophilaceae archaeon]|nr:nascent polypeptide-associated complex subunit alpha [Candidatus Methanomethylophilaceae archaeon]